MPGWPRLARPHGMLPGRVAERYHYLWSSQEHAENRSRERDYRDHIAQILTAVMIDRFGIMGVEKVPFRWIDLLGVVLLAVGTRIMLK